MSLKGCASTLGQASRQLSAEWQDLHDYWRDEKAREFEEKYLAPLPTLVRKSVEAMEELERVLRKVKADCE